MPNHTHFSSRIKSIKKKMMLKTHARIWICKVNQKTLLEIYLVRDGDADAEFDTMYNRLEAKWPSTINGDKCVKYIEEHKREKLWKNMTWGLMCVLAGGLGNPPVEYTQNANESVNSMVKRAKDTGILTLKDIITFIKQEANNQRDKIKLAQIGKGEWRVKEEFVSGNESTSQTYYCMSEKQGKDFLYKLSTPVSETTHSANNHYTIERQRYK